MKKIFFVLSVLFLVNIASAYSQDTTEDQRKKITYPEAREADIIWKKRVIRKIDLRVKMNQPLVHIGAQLYLDRTSLPQETFKSIMDFSTFLENEGASTNSMPAVGISNIESKLFTKDIQLYDGSKWPFTKKADVAGLFRDGLELRRLDSLNSVQLIESVIDKFEQINSYLIFEEWYFDSKYSRMFVRILGLSPLLEVEKEGGQKASKRLFWIRYDDIRDSFINCSVFNPHNDKLRMSLDDVFQKRYFESVIMGEENVQGNRMLDEIYSDVRDPKERIRLIEIERKRIEEEIFNFEHDVWEY